MSKYNSITEDTEQELVSRVLEATKPLNIVPLIDAKTLNEELKSEPVRFVELTRITQTLRAIEGSYIQHVCALLALLDIDVAKIIEQNNEVELPDLLKKMKDAEEE